MKIITKGLKRFNLNGKINLFPLFSHFVNSTIKSILIEFLNFDVWGHLSKRFHLSPKQKFDIFFYSSIVIAALLDVFFIKSYFRFFSYTLIVGISMLINYKWFYEIKNIRRWEVLLGVILIISSFTIITPIKWQISPNTKTFGVFNGGVFILGYFILFYGIRKYKKLWAFYTFYILLVLLNGSWDTIVGNFAERYLSPITAHMAYFLLKTLGYSVTINGTTISIITKIGNIISVTVAGACSGIMGVTLFTLMIVGLLIGSNIRYRVRMVIIIMGALIIFILNIIRITLILISGYYYGQNGLEIAHHWLGDILFLTFVLTYWYLIDKKIIQKMGEKSGI